MSIRLSDHAVSLPDSDHASPRAPGKASLTQRLVRSGSAPAVEPVQRAIDPAAAAIQRAQLAHDLAAACGFVGGPADSIDASAARVQRQVDAHTGLDDHAIASHAARGVSGGGGPLPHLDAIQRAFGPDHDVTGVRAHVGGAAAEASTAIGAHAYATGDDVAFASSPDLFLAAHEAAHVVQQRQGVSLKGAVGQAGDAYEQHADAVADAVVRGDSAAALLGRGGGQSGSGSAMQRVINAPIDEGGAPPAPLPAETRAKLIDDAGNRIDKAFTAFTSACIACSASFTSEMTSAEAFAFQLVEVALGYLVPGLGKAANLLLSKSVPIYAADIVQKAALSLIEADGITKALTWATDKGKTHLMTSAPAMVSTDVKAMLTRLQSQTQVAMQKVGESLSGCPDNGLLALHAAYDATNTNVETYTVAVQRIIAQYQRTVVNIGKSERGQQGKAGGEWTYSWTNTTRVYWVRGQGGIIGLGLFDVLSGNKPGTATASNPRGHQQTFLEWVPEHFVAAALAHSEDKGHKVSVIDEVDCE